MALWWVVLGMGWVAFAVAQPVSSTAVVADVANAVEANRLLERQRARLAQWQHELQGVQARHDELVAQTTTVERQVQQLRRTQASMQAQIEVLQGSVLLSRVLQELQTTLPVVRIDTDLPDQIATWRLRQFDLAPARALPGGPNAYARDLLADLPPEQVTPGLRAELSGLLREQQQVLDALGDATTALVQQAVTLQLLQGELQVLALQVHGTIQEQLFWLPSQPPISWSWIRSIPAGVQAQLADVSWSTGWTEFLEGLQHRPLLFLPVLILAAGLLVRRGWIRARLRTINDAVGDVHRESQWHTPLAVLLNLLLALPGTLVLALAGFALKLDAQGQNLALGDSLLHMSIVWLVFHTAQRLLIPGGVAERHFGWDPTENAGLRRRLIALGVVVLGMVGVVTFAEFHAAGLVDDYIGNLIVLVGYAVMAWLMATLLTHTAQRQHLPLGRLAGGVLMALMPLVLILAVALGYYYTAVRLTDRLVDTLYLIIVWRLLDGMVLRALAVAGRRLAWQEVLRGAAAARAADLGPDGEVSVEAPARDVGQMKEQSVRLARPGLFAVAAVGLYWIWSDVLSVFTYLNNVVLYQFTSGTGDAASLVPISLLDVLGAIVIAVVAVVLARNLPGLLEVMVLSRLTLAQGSSYAITTLLSYVIVSTGFIATLGTLGVSWDKLQWLVAALSVGLGFGLQEIFANFVSGIIILFERPVRIGDVVTVGNLSGTVTRIRTRATTIVDFERKEIIVPNKTFVTSHLVNWTLSDTVTRVTITVGVAYGSDLDKVRDLLLQIAHDNPRVLRDPEPSVWFLTFGASTLDHEMRVHVAALSDRTAAIDEINRAIDREFAVHGIEIAFNQIDVHVRSIDGREARLETLVHHPAAASATPGGPPSTQETSA